jgi:hypothetical protein
VPVIMFLMKSRWPGASADNQQLQMIHRVQRCHLPMTVT